MKLSNKNIKALQEWQQEGCRTVKIKIEPEGYRTDKNDPVWIYVYDYNLMSGCRIQKRSDLPTAEVMKNKQIESLRRQLLEMEGVA